MIVDPWGLVLAEMPDGDGLAVADLDFARLEEVRARLPALRHRRPDVYGGGTADASNVRPGAVR
jgi:predicted amidohydrolase